MTIRLNLELETGQWLVNRRVEVTKYTPKVGDKCNAELTLEWKLAPTYVERLVITAVGENHVLARNDNGEELPYSFDDFSFSPVKSQVDIEREEAIAIVCEALGLEESELIPNIKSAVLVLLNEGYRKQGEVVDIEQVEKDWLESSEMVWIYFLDANYTITKKVKR